MIAMMKLPPPRDSIREDVWLRAWAIAAPRYVEADWALATDFADVCLADFDARSQRPAIADTHPEGGDVEQAPLVSGGGSEGNRTA